MKKIALITACFGGINDFNKVPKQALPNGYTLDIFQINERNCPIPMPNFNNRLKARYIKLQMHRIEMFKEYDYFLWIDASVLVKSYFFVKNAIDNHSNYGLLIGKHNKRDCIYDEIDFVINEINSGNEYLRMRYERQDLINERKFYKSVLKVPAKQGLFSSGIFFRKNTYEMNEFFDNWMMYCLQFSYFDQPSLMAAIHLRDKKFVDIIYKSNIIIFWEYGDVVNNEFFELVRHKKVM